MMEPKVFSKLLMTCSVSTMTMSTHGIREGSKADPPDEAKVGKNKMRKGKGKGRGGRRFFRSRRQGKGKGRRKGRSHMVGEEGYARRLARRRRRME